MTQLRDWDPRDLEPKVLHYVGSHCRAQELQPWKSGLTSQPEKVSCPTCIERLQSHRRRVKC